MIPPVLWVLVVTGPILLFWLVMSREPQLRWIIAALIVGQATMASMLVYFFPRAALEILLAAPVLGLVTAVSGRLIERRRLGPEGPARAGVATYLLAGWSLVALCGVAVVWQPAPFFPATDGALPLPDGLHAKVHPSDDGDCGSGSCTRTITVTGRPGQADDDLYAEVQRHVKTRGWGSGCRPVGWLLDPTTECIELAAKGNHVTIQLWGNRDDLQHLTTIG
jgi:hypothetical protein